MSDVILCPKHSIPMRWVASGISKKTGKRFRGFWSCPHKDENGYCDQTFTPQQPGPKEAQFQQDMAEGKADQKERKIEQMYKDKSEKIEKFHNENMVAAEKLANALNRLADTIEMGKLDKAVRKAEEVDYSGEPEGDFKTSG